MNIGKYYGLGKMKNDLPGIDRNASSKVVPGFKGLGNGLSTVVSAHCSKSRECPKSAGTIVLHGNCLQTQGGFAPPDI